MDGTFIQVEAWQVITLLVGIVVSFLSGIFLFGKFIKIQTQFYRQIEIWDERNA